MEAAAVALWMHKFLYFYDYFEYIFQNYKVLWKLMYQIASLIKFIVRIIIMQESGVTMQIDDWSF